MTHFFLSLILLLSLQQSPDTTAQFNRAVALQKAGRLADAENEYRELIRLKPDYVEAHANLGIVLARQGKYDEAITSYETALRLSPQLLPVLLNLGIAHYRAGQFDKAVPVLERFLEMKPDYVQARQLYGLSLSALGKEEEAIKQLEPTLDSAPPDPAVLYALGVAYLHLGKAGFLATLQRLASFPAGLPTLHLLQGLAFLRDQEFEKALEELQTAEGLNSDLPRLDFSLGLAHLKLGHNKEAITSFEKAIARGGNDFSSLYYLAEALTDNGDLDSARQRLDMAIKLDPKSPMAGGLLGKILFKQGKASEALKPLEIAVAGMPADTERRYLLARVYQQLGRKEDAAREFAEVQRLKAKELKEDREKLAKP